MLMRNILIICLLSTILIAANLGDIDNELQYLLEDASPTGSIEHWGLAISRNDIPADPKNRITNYKIDLGKKLFYKQGLSVNTNRPDTRGTVSCASCHSPRHGWKAGIPQGIGEGGVGEGQFRRRYKTVSKAKTDVQPIATPTIINVAYQRSIAGWTGRFGGTGDNADLPKSPLIDQNLYDINNKKYDGIVSQAMAAIGVHRLDISEYLIDDMGLKDDFDRTFSHIPKHRRYSAETAALALDAYQRNVIPYDAPFQQYLRGDISAMRENEKRGAVLFFGKAGCVNCHNSPAFSSNSDEFYAVGFKDLDQHPDKSVIINKKEDKIPDNLGREMMTCDANDKYTYKTPQLYNLRDFIFFGHGSSLTSVSSVINYFNEASSENSRVTYNYLSSDFKPLRLSSSEMKDLESFLVNALYDDDMERYVPVKHR